LVQPGARLSGADGCHRIAGRYQLKGDAVTFAQMVGTQMACVNPSGTEGPFRSALKSAARLTIAGNWRTSSVGPLRGSSSGPVAWFRARGIAVQRVLSDNGIGYVARAFGGRAVMPSAPASSHARLYAAHQRQGPAIHSNTHAGVGVRLPLCDLVARSPRSAHGSVKLVRLGGAESIRAPPASRQSPPPVAARIAASAAASFTCSTAPCAAS
jgi:hypothetical protein